MAKTFGMLVHVLVDGKELVILCGLVLLFFVPIQNVTKLKKCNGSKFYGLDSIYNVISGHKFSNSSWFTGS